MVVPQSTVGKVIGSKGATVSTLKARSGADISISRNTLEGTPLQPIIVTGTVSETLIVVEAIDQIMLDLAKAGAVSSADWSWSLQRKSETPADKRGIWVSTPADKRAAHPKLQGKDEQWTAAAVHAQVQRRSTSVRSPPRTAGDAQRNKAPLRTASASPAPSKGSYGSVPRRAHSVGPGQYEVRQVFRPSHLSGSSPSSPPMHMKPQRAQSPSSEASLIRHLLSEHAFKDKLRLLLPADFTENVLRAGRQSMEVRSGSRIEVTTHEADESVGVVTISGHMLSNSQAVLYIQQLLLQHRGRAGPPPRQRR